tara:strand:+ start:95 stop:964 length:870 start_codon:yes stop_codon:yes gene_type:complete
MSNLEACDLFLSSEETMREHWRASRKWFVQRGTYLLFWVASFVALCLQSGGKVEILFLSVLVYMITFFVWSIEVSEVARKHWQIWILYRDGVYRSSLVSSLDEEAAIELHLLTDAFSFEFYDYLREDEEHLRVGMHDSFFAEDYASIRAKVSISEFYRAYGRTLSFVLWHEGEQKVIGMVTLNDIDYSSKNALLSYSIASHWEGRELMTKGVERVCELAFSELELHRLYAFVAPDNTRSVALLERLKFEREGLLKSHVHMGSCFLDTYCYGLLCAEEGSSEDSEDRLPR